jgi:hypothetical protein
MDNVQNKAPVTKEMSALRRNLTNTNQDGL